MDLTIEQVKQDMIRFSEQEYTNSVPIAELPTKSNTHAPQILHKLGSDSAVWTIPDELSVIEQSPSLMPLAQRLFLWSFIYGTAPKRYLEIGTDAGGSAMIVMSAIRALGLEDFQGVCIDPSFKLTETTREYLGEYFTYIHSKNSPEAMITATNHRSPFDLILVDGDHTYDYALLDILLTIPYLARGGYILVDDAAHPQVRDAIRYVLENSQLIDCGFMCRHTITCEAYVPSGVWQGEDMRASGLYILRKPV